MICEPCRKGADYLDIAKHAGMDIEDDLPVAQDMHERCKGCDCQHRVELQMEGRSVRK